MAFNWYDRASNWRDRAIAAFYLIGGPVAAVQSFSEIAIQLAHRFWKGTWHFQTLADLWHGPGAPPHQPSWLLHLPLAPLYLVIGLLMFRTGFEYFFGDSKAGNEKKDT